MPPRDRNVAMVFQNYALYPHLTVFENIGFAAAAAQGARRPRQARVDEAAEHRWICTEHLLAQARASFPAASGSGSRWAAPSSAHPPRS